MVEQLATRMITFSVGQQRCSQIATTATSATCRVVVSVDLLEGDELAPIPLPLQVLLHIGHRDEVLAVVLHRQLDGERAVVASHEAVY